MSLIDHLEELRTTVMRSGVIIVLAVCICYGLSDQISEYLLQPLRQALGHGTKGQIVYLGLLDKVIAQIQVGIWSGVLLSSPLWFYEVWRFIRPGLYDHELRAVRPFLFVGFVLFWAGVLFCYYVVFPLTFNLLMDLGVSDVTAAISLQEYLITASKVLVFFGLAFQLPNVLLILGFMGIVTKYSLRTMRRYVYVGLSVAAAILTPPDVVSMMVVWVPMVVLYELGILAVSVIVHPYLARQHLGENK
jgi:sec-independent protein translocase protein TatC